MFGSDEREVMLDRLADLAVERDRLDAEVAALVACADEIGAWTACPHQGARRFLRHHGRQSATAVRSTLARARLLGRFHGTAAALARGGISLGAVDAIAETVSKERERCYRRDEALLLSHAILLPLEAFEALLSHWASLADDTADPTSSAHITWHQHLAVQQRFDGGADVFGALDEHTAQTLLAALDAFDPGPDPLDDPGRRGIRQRRADALGEVASAALGQRCSASSDTGSDGSMRSTRLQRPPVSDTTIVVDAATLAGRTRSADLEGLVSEVNGRTISGRAVAALLCDSWVSALVLDARGAVIDATERSAPFSSTQRRLLAARDRGCVVPGCTRPPSHCDAHHVIPRNVGGPNTLDNACLLCRRHHRLVHAGWSVRRDDRRRSWTITSPTGRIWSAVPAADRRRSDPPP